MEVFSQIAQGFLSHFRPSSHQQTDPGMGSQSGNCGNMTRYTPSYADICDARNLLRSLKLPAELVLQILDDAEYWPSLRFTGQGTTRAGARADYPDSATVQFSAGILPANIREELGIRGENENPKLREVEFEILSRDQGWTSKGTESEYNAFANPFANPKALSH
jgi:hypothetical protein